MKKKLTNQKLLNSILFLLLVNTTLGYGIDLNNDTISNKLIINKGGDIDVSRESNGIYNENIKSNNGIISGDIKLASGADISGGYTSSINSGNGLYGDIENNNGTILGNIVSSREDLIGSKSVDSIANIGGNGIHGKIKENNGVIVGSVNLKAGTVTTSSSTVVKAVANSDDSGNGVEGSIEKNSGVVIGSSTLKGGSATSNSASDATNYAISLSRGSGNGIGGNIEENKGAILGNTISLGGSSIATSSSTNSVTAIANANSNYSGNGVYGKIKENNGIIAGNLIVSGGTAVATSASPLGYASIPYGNVISEESGNGISGTLIEKTTNNGVVSGYISANAGTYNGKKDYEKIFYSGNGIGISSNLSGTINNSGVIKGSQSAIAAPFIDGVINNYGILAGREIFSYGKEMIKNESFEDLKNLEKIVIKNENNQGIYVKLKSEMNGSSTTGKVELDSNENPIIEKIVIGLGGSIDGKEIINGDNKGNIAVKPTTIVGSSDTYLNSSNLLSEENLIINGTGIAKGSLVIEKDLKLKDSIINGYNTAVYLEDNSQLTATNVTFNGGGLKNNISVIKGGAGNSILNVEGDSIVNGKIDLGEGNDVLSIENTVLINEDIDGGLGTDTLNLGNKSLVRENQALNIYHEIKGFETINTNGDIKVFEIAKIGDGNINLQSGNLTLRVNPLERNQNGDIIGHALYDHKGNISSEDGNLLIGLNGVGKNEIIATNGTTIDKGMDTIYSETDKLKTNSLVLDAILLENGNIKISILDYIPLPSPPVEPGLPENPPLNPPKNQEMNSDSLLYKHLNKVYKSIVSAGEIGKLANTTLLEGKTYNESLGGLLTMLDQIYANNPYAYTVKSSRDSLKLFEDNMSYLTIKPNEGEWIAQGKAIYTG
ncbi:MAG: beta strand repeat-containing protein, partial [Fusobacteriaceae bacterium]